MTQVFPPPSPIPPPSPATIPALVGPQYCAPYSIDLTVTKKTINLTDGDFVVTDINGNLILQVKCAVLGMRDRRVVVDAAGFPIVSMHQKIISMHRRWQVFRGDSSSHKDLLFSARKSGLIQLKTELHVFVASNSSEDHCDFKVKGSYYDRSCSIYDGASNALLARMSRQYSVRSITLGKDAFGVTIYPNVDYAFIVALIVILDEINKDRKD